MHPAARPPNIARTIDRNTIDKTDTWDSRSANKFLPTTKTTEAFLPPCHQPVHTPPAFIGATSQPYTTTVRAPSVTSPRSAPFPVGVVRFARCQSAAKRLQKRQIGRPLRLRRFPVGTVYPSRGASCSCRMGPEVLITFSDPSHPRDSAVM